MVTGPQGISKVNSVTYPEASIDLFITTIIIGIELLQVLCNYHYNLYLFKMLLIIHNILKNILKYNFLKVFKNRLSLMAVSTTQLLLL